MRRAVLVVVLAAGILPRGEASDVPSHVEEVPVRGVTQTLHVYGDGDRVAIVTSGDGGWTHLGPEVAEILAAQGYRVVGLDAKAYLASFTSRSGPLHAEEVPRDYEALLDHARASRALLVGVSEGAGLSVLAAADPALHARVAGVVALGLPDRNELGWRFRDSLIYLTKRTPDEPTFSARDVVPRVAPVPLAAIHSRHDEFVPVPEVEDILRAARDPKRLWLLDASDHRFSDGAAQLGQALAEAVAWIGSASAPGP
jgi:pimeloyl-ACP methyl ester carboxylesterase